MKRSNARFAMIIACIFIIAAFATVISINQSVVNSTDKFILSNPDKVPPMQVALILGAYVLPSGNLSDMLADRVLDGIELYKKGKVKKLLLSGDHGRHSYDEVNAMRRFALHQGIPAADIFMDHAGFDTYSSMYRAKKIFQVQSMVIVTQRFHLPRAVFIARGLRIAAIGLVADRRRYLPGAERYSETREIPARVKAFLDMTFRRKPKFLGKVLPVSGDGRMTWD